jgi:hypothetical protein
MEKEEEDPEKVMLVLADGEHRPIVPDVEDTPTTNTRSHIPRMSARTYMNLYKVKI